MKAMFQFPQEDAITNLMKKTIVIKPVLVAR